MPLYEYQCPKDGTFERMQKFSDPPLSACPTCGGPVEKLLSAPAIQFKGSGWYITDYARKSKGGDAAREKGGSEKADSAGEKKDTKESKGTSGTGAAAPASSSASPATDKK